MRFLRRFRAVLRDVVKRTKEADQVALLFSGGTDSLTVLWTLLELRADVTCYTFRLENVESTDSKVAQIAADTWGVPVKIITAPYQEPDQLRQDVSTVIRIIESGRKTHVEVMWAYWYLFQAIEEKYVWSGIQADTLYGSSKSMAIKYAKDPEAFRAAREKAIANPDQEGLKQAGLLADHFGKIFHAPYSSLPVREFMLSYSWRQLNRPKQKMPAVLGFEEEFRRAPIYRRNDNLQCGSGIREYMQRMSDEPIVKLYKEILNEGPGNP